MATRMVITERRGTKMPENIRVLLIEPGEAPRLKTIPHALHDLQSLVSDTIQIIYPYTDQVALVCGDNSKLNHCEPNRVLEDDAGKPYDIICGPFFITGLTTDNLGSISDELAEKYSRKFQYPELFLRTTDGNVMQIKVGSGIEPKKLF